MSFPTCAATGLPLEGWGNYQQHVVQYERTRVEVNPDGSAARYVEEAGLFCGDACLSAWLEGWTTEAHPPRTTLLQRPLPCVRKANPQDFPADSEPF